MEVAVESLEVIRAMAEIGLPASASDAGVGALCARTAALGAGLNVRINAKELEDESQRAEYVSRAEALAEQARVREQEVLALVEEQLGG